MSWNIIVRRFPIRMYPFCRQTWFLISLHVKESCRGIHFSRPDNFSWYSLLDLIKSIFLIWFLRLIPSTIQLTRSEIEKRRVVLSRCHRAAISQKNLATNDDIQGLIALKCIQNSRRTLSAYRADWPTGQTGWSLFLSFFLQPAEKLIAFWFEFSLPGTLQLQHTNKNYSIPEWTFFTWNFYKCFSKIRGGILVF